MLENPAFGLGLLGGIVLGGLAVGAWISARLRARFDGELCRALARAQFAETLAEELRRGEQADQAEVDRLRGELADAMRARAIAETQAAETVKRAEEQQTVLAAESFQALSGEALKQNNEAFLTLARSTFQTLHAEAKGDLAQRQQAIDELVKPLSESLHRYDEQLRHLEQSRQAAYGGLDQHLKLLAETQQRLQQETGNLVNALKAPAVRGRWGEITLKRVAELAGMVAHCDFFEQESVTSSDGRLRPDMVVQLPGGRQIIVDAKTVLGGYLEAHEAADEERRQEGLRRHAAQVRLRINDLSLKAYWSQFDSSERH